MKSALYKANNARNLSKNTNLSFCLMSLFRQTTATRFLVAVLALLDSIKFDSIQLMNNVFER